MEPWCYGPLYALVGFVVLFTVPFSFARTLDEAHTDGAFLEEVSVMG